MDDIDAQMRDYVKIEEELIEEFVKANPYPPYKEIYNLLEKQSDSDLTYLDMFCEYGEKNHICCKIIYDNPNNEELIVDMGKKIYERGGKWALQQNLRVLRLIYSNSTHPIIKGHARMIEDYFHQKVSPEWLN